MAELGANRAGQFLRLMPAFGTVLSMLFLGERLAPLQWLACAVVLGAVIAGQRADSIEKI